MSYSAVLASVVAITGPQGAIRLVRAKGGQDMGLPYVQNLHDTHWLVVLVGFDHAAQLCRHFEGQRIKLPIEVNSLLQLRDEAIAEDYNAGRSVSQLAHDYEIDRRLIQRVLDRFGLRGKLIEPDMQLGLEM